MRRVFVGIVFALSSANAAEPEADYEWYGRVTSGYLWADGQADLIGSSESVYGGSPGFSLDDGGSFSLAAGRRLPNGWRIEGELTLLTATADTAYVSGFEQRSNDTFRLDGEIASTVLMVNSLFDLSVRSDLFEPYLKLGAGIARNEASAILDIQFDSSIWTGTAYEGESLTGHVLPDAYETSFTWNIGLGLRTPLNDRFLLALEYGYIDPGEAASGIDANNDAIVYSDLSGQRFLLGLDFRF